jgi:hypothetical protein
MSALVQKRRFRAEINFRSLSNLMDSVNQGLLEEGHTGLLLDEDMHATAFAPPSSLSSFLTPGAQRDVLARRALHGALAVEAGVLAAVDVGVGSSAMPSSSRAVMQSDACGVLSLPAPLSQADGRRAAFDLALAAIVRRRFSCILLCW